MQVKLVLHANEVLQNTAAIQQRMQNLAPAMTAIKEVALDSIRQTFAAGGRPTRWPPLRAPRARGSLGSAIPLNDTGALRSSITGVSSAHTVTLGTNHAYARVHQYGATIQIPETRPRPPRRALRIRLSDGAFIFRRRAAAHSVHIPARPFLVIQKEDIATFITIVRRFLLQGR